MHTSQSEHDRRSPGRVAGSGSDPSAPTRQYAHAPITEAIIDIRVELPPGAGMADLGRVHAGLEASYPTLRSRTAPELHGQTERAGAAAVARSKSPGFLFTSADGRQCFQAKLDGFSMHRLAPYGRWAPFRDEARRLWDAYRRMLEPVRINRLAVRFVNRLDLPMPVRELREYLRTVPEVSSDLPQELAGYFMQLRIPQDDISASLLISQAIIEPSRPGVASVVLDIDVFCTDAIPSDEEDRWALIETFRQRKNAVFEACITDKARRLFD